MRKSNARASGMARVVAAYACAMGKDVAGGRGSVLEEPVVGRTLTAGQLRGTRTGEEYQHSECFAGEPQTATYTTGGYFYRPANTVGGGPESMALTESVWVLRERTAGQERTAEACQ